MKHIFHKLLCLAVLAVAFVFPARAQYTTQLEENTLPVGEFSTVDADGDFELTLSKGSYGVRVTADKNLMPYVQVYVRSKTLFITYDEKSVPKDIKKLYKGKNAPKPVFRAVVSLPQVNGFTLNDNVTLLSTEEFFGNNVSVTLNDKAQVRNLNLRANSITVSMKKNTQATLSLVADEKLELNTDDKAILKLTEKAREMVLNAKGGSDVAFSGECEVLNLNLGDKSSTNLTQRAQRAILSVGGSSKLTMNGSAEFLEARGGKNAEVEAAAFPVQNMKAELDGSCKVNVSVEKELNVSLQGGSTLIYTGSPLILVNKIVKSTLAPAGTSLK